MATLIVPFPLDADAGLSVPAADGRLLNNWKEEPGDVSPIVDAGADVLSIDSAYVRSESSANNNLAFSLSATALSALSGATINSVTFNVAHRAPNDTVAVGLQLFVPFVGSTDTSYDQNQSPTAPTTASLVTDPANATYTVTFTTDPNAGGAWTTAKLYATYFILYHTTTAESGVTDYYDVDKIWLSIDYTGAVDWWTLTEIPAALVQDAQSLQATATQTALERFQSIWDARIGSTYTIWLYYYFLRFKISFPAAIPIHWYITGTRPGTSWTTTTEPTPYGWFQSIDGYTGAANLVIGDAPHNPRSFTDIAAFATGAAGMLGGAPGAGVNFRNHFIYASGGYTIGTDSPSLRIFDGLSDRVITTIPNTSTGAVPKAIMSMILVGETIYFSTLDSGTNSSNFAGRVFSFNPITGNMSQIGSGFASGEVPYALCWHMNRLWVGTNTSGASGGKVYFFRIGIDADWTTDYTLATSSVGCVCSLASYKGQLFIGADNGAGSFAKVLVRSSLGAYSTSLTATGGTARVNNGFLSMFVFNDNLYTGYWNSDTTAVAKIYKYDNSSWTAAYTGSSGTLRPFIALFQSGSALFAIGGGKQLTAALLSTADGASWTDLTPQLTGGDSTAIPIFGEVVI